jgi:hypothetical protein
VGRSLKPITLTKSGRPGGPRWVLLRKRLFAMWGPAPPCVYCRHPVFGPDRGEIAHIISPLIRPDLAWSVSNLRPAHGSGPRRCADCGLNCNWVSHNSPLAPRGPNGESLPFSEDLIVKLQRGLSRKPPPAPVLSTAKLRSPLVAS